MIHSFLLLLKHDIYEGIFCKWKYFFVAVLFFVFVDFVFVNNVNSLSNADNQVLKCSITDIIINMFIGNEPFDPEVRKGIGISVTWFVFHTLLFSFTGFYISDDMKKNATSLILSVKSRKMWWTSKFLWCVIAVVTYYALFFITAVIFAAIFGTASFSLSNLIAENFFEMHISDASVCNIVFSSLLLPMIISISIAVFETTLSLILKPVYNFLIVVFYLAASAFYCSAYLLFNFSMVIRNKFYAVNGVLNQYGVIFAIIITITCYLIGIILIKRKDII